MVKGRKNFTTSIEFDVAKDFNKIATGLGKKPAALMRDFIIAAVEDRIKITPSKNTNTKFHRNIYSQ